MTIMMHPNRLVLSRRAAVLAIGAAAVAPSAARGQDIAVSEQTLASLKAIGGGTPITPGRVKLVMPELAENGNAVSLTITVDSPMQPNDYVRMVHVVSDKNPIAEVVKFHLGPRAGRARVQTNIRLAMTQTVTAVAEMNDGTFWSGSTDVIVTLAACLESG